MISNFLSRSGSVLFAMIALFSMALCLSQGAVAAGAKLRLICATSLKAEHEVVLASHGEGGAWHEYGMVKLRDSLISDWLPAVEGELHLAVRKEGKLESLCHFTYPEGASRGLVILVADTAAETYAAHFVDPVKAGFEKGDMLIFNLGGLDGTVIHGTREIKVPAGERALVKPSGETGGMSRIQVTCTDANAQPQTCYDRYVSGNANTRYMMFLFPSEPTGLRVMSMAMLGELD